MNLVPVDELMQRLARRESAETITRTLRQQTGARFSIATVRAVAKAHGWTFPGHNAARRRIDIPNLPDYARRYDEGESLATLAAQAGVSPRTLTNRLEEAGLHTPHSPRSDGMMRWAAATSVPRTRP